MVDGLHFPVTISESLKILPFVHLGCSVPFNILKPFYFFPIFIVFPLHSPMFPPQLRSMYQLKCLTHRSAVALLAGWQTYLIQILFPFDWTRSRGPGQLCDSERKCDNKTKPALKCCTVKKFELQQWLELCMPFIIHAHSQIRYSMCKKRSAVYSHNQWNTDISLYKSS